MIRFLRTKIGLALVIAIIIVSGAFIFKLKNNTVENEVASKVSLIADASVENALKSGELELPNWEEVLRSISGGASTTEAIVELAENNAETKTEESLTATDRFARAFFDQYVKIKESGAAIDEDTGMNIVNQLLAEDFGGPELEPVFNLTDLTISSDISPSAIKKYGNALAQAFNQSVPKDYENELSIINRVSETEKTQDLQKLAQNKDYFERMRNAVLVVTVPSSLRNAHLVIINALSAVIDGVNGMMLMTDDPVGAVRGITRYQDGLNALDLSTKEISAYFKRQKIVFSSQEPGYLFAE